MISFNIHTYYLPISSLSINIFTLYLDTLPAYHI